MSEIGTVPNNMSGEKEVAFNLDTMDTAEPVTVSASYGGDDDLQYDDTDGGEISPDSLHRTDTAADSELLNSHFGAEMSTARDGQESPPSPADEGPSGRDLLKSVRGRALLVGINYVDQPEYEQKSCIDSVYSVQRSLRDEGFRGDVRTLCDNGGVRSMPYRDSIMQGVDWLLQPFGRDAAGASPMTLLLLLAGVVVTQRRDGALRKCLLPADHQSTTPIVLDSLVYELRSRLPLGWDCVVVLDPHHLRSVVQEGGTQGTPGTTSPHKVRFTTDAAATGEGAEEAAGGAQGCLVRLADMQNVLHSEFVVAQDGMEEEARPRNPPGLSNGLYVNETGGSNRVTLITARCEARGDGDADVDLGVGEAFAKALREQAQGGAGGGGGGGEGGAASEHPRVVDPRLAEYFRRVERRFGSNLLQPFADADYQLKDFATWCGKSLQDVRLECESAGIPTIRAAPLQTLTQEFFASRDATQGEAWSPLSPPASPQPLPVESFADAPQGSTLRELLRAFRKHLRATAGGAEVPCDAVALSTDFTMTPALDAPWMHAEQALLAVPPAPAVPSQTYAEGAAVMPLTPVGAPPADSRDSLKYFSPSRTTPEAGTIQPGGGAYVPMDYGNEQRIFNDLREVGVVPKTPHDAVYVSDAAQGNPLPPPLPPQHQAPVPLPQAQAPSSPPLVSQLPPPPPSALKKPPGPAAPPAMTPLSSPAVEQKSVGIHLHVHPPAPPAPQRKATVSPPAQPANTPNPSSPSNPASSTGLPNFAPIATAGDARAYGGLMRKLDSAIQQLDTRQPREDLLFTPGYISSGGDLLGSPRFMSLAEAKELCMQTPECVGFSYEHRGAGQRVVVGEDDGEMHYFYFKNKADVYEGLPWISYIKPSAGGVLNTAPQLSATPSQAPPLLEGVVPQQAAQVAPLQMRQRLARFYERYNKEKLPSVTHTLSVYQGSEDVLFQQLVQHYGPEPPAVDPPLPPGWLQVQSPLGDIFYKHVGGTKQWGAPVMV